MDFLFVKSIEMLVRSYYSSILGGLFMMLIPLTIIWAVGIGVSFMLSITFGPIGFVTSVATGRWQVFRKMGLEGWKSFVPMYNTYCLMKKFYEDDGKNFWFLLIPLYNIYVYIKFKVDFAKAFKATTGQILAWIFIPGFGVIFYAIAGHSDVDYKDGSYGQKDDLSQVFGSVSLGGRAPEAVRASVAPEEKKPANYEKICPNCGNVLKPNAKFCTKCGHKID